MGLRFICLSSGTSSSGWLPTGRRPEVDGSPWPPGRLSAGFGPAEQSPLVHCSSHRLFARPAQNPVSSDFLCSCIIFPCFLNACPQCGSSSMTLLSGEQDVEGGQGCGNVTQGCPGPCGWRAGEQGSPNYLAEDFSSRVVRETVQVYTHRRQSS